MLVEILSFIFTLDKALPKICEGFPYSANFNILYALSGETEEAQRLRFQVELEFVQCLASPNYLHCEF